MKARRGVQVPLLLSEDTCAYVTRAISREMRASCFRHFAQSRSYRVYSIGQRDSRDYFRVTEFLWSLVCRFAVRVFSRAQRDTSRSGLISELIKVFSYRGKKRDDFFTNILVFVDGKIYIYALLSMHSDKIASQILGFEACRERLMLDLANVTSAAYEFLPLSIAFRFRQHPTLADFPLDDHPASCFPSFFSRCCRLDGVILPRANCGR